VVTRGDRVSRHLINEYRAELDRLRAVTGSTRETNLRPAFARLLRAWGKQGLDLVFVEEHQMRTAQGNLISVDGALLHTLRVPFGYWEAKDEKDDLDAEIAAKTRKGYPRDNIVYSDDRTAVLIQDGGEQMRVPMDDTDALYDLLTRFFAHERQEIADFNKAVKQFAADLPEILTALRQRIAEKRDSSREFAAAEAAFLKHARDAINPAVSEDDVQEMLIQHILTEDIFAKVFDNPDFHRLNNVAAELKRLEDVLFGRGEKAGLLKALSSYYSGIASTAALISSHSEKQGFLKALYEDFYKAYNKKAADRLGVVYTPGEIVRFMIRSADWLCEKHFGKNLVDPGVEILDPATGTGTFIVELLEHFRGHHDKLRHKYKEELHANEVAILPYYVANLNIEATYQAITGQFAEFENLCLVDTLDNVDALGIHSGYQHDLLGGLADENMERVKRQNRRKISVIIGNPPYNANQQNENDNNKNRTYAHIDKRIKETYIKESTAQKTKLYDMYVRFVRWASDRIGDEGIVAFVTNRSFIDARMADGLRRSLASQFSDAWIADLGGDYKKSGVGGSGNVFGIGTGVAISFWIKSLRKPPVVLRYFAAASGSGEEKLSWLATSTLDTASASVIAHPEHGSWINAPQADTSGLLPLADRNTKQGGTKKTEQSIFKLFSLGIVSARDDWVYDRDKVDLFDKLAFFQESYSKAISNLLPWADLDADEPRFANGLKWTRSLKANARKRRLLPSPPISQSTYRPFTKLWLAYPSALNEMEYRNKEMFSLGRANNAIVFSDISGRGDFSAHVVDAVMDYNYAGSVGGFQQVARYRYADSGERIDNITDWALAQFREHYERSPSLLGEELDITKDAIFHYVYAVLNDPVYRETYALNLKREFPRIPFYPDFARWAAWGEALMAMHIGYEKVEPWPTTRVEMQSKRAEGTTPKPILKSHPHKGAVVVDAETQLAGIPLQAWDYRLGNRSAIDWVLDQHKEKKPRDPTIRARFNTYRFADYKESMIALLAKVARVSVDTVAITDAMTALNRENW